MPACIAAATGVANDLSPGLLLMTQVAMPLALAATAVLMADVISEMMEFCEPVHFGVGMPSKAAASASPDCVGTKNRFVVTWLTKQNCHAGTEGKLPAAATAAEAEPLLELLELPELLEP